VMLQQTPVVRVEPVWRQWMSLWPEPAALAESAPGEAIHAWGTLGYPRRALRLHAAAVAMVERHGGQVPDTSRDLLALPGLGPYTAAAVSSFAFGRRATVVDTNVRRVFARIVDGAAQAAPSLTRAEMDLATSLLPEAADVARSWSVAVMEVGALVCSARRPRCPDCPVHDLCAWHLGGRPAYAGPARRTQSWQGTDRQCRGAILAVLRATKGPVTAGGVDAAWSTDDAQRDRCLGSLIFDGLVEPMSRNRFRLPGRQS
jgi:A/G-specific adenine glycosylase